MTWIDKGEGNYKCPNFKNEFFNGLELKYMVKYFPKCPICGVELNNMNINKGGK